MCKWDSLSWGWIYTCWLCNFICRMLIILMAVVGLGQNCTSHKTCPQGKKWAKTDFEDWICCVLFTSFHLGIWYFRKTGSGHRSPTFVKQSWVWTLFQFNQRFISSSQFCSIIVDWEVENPASFNPLLLLLVVTVTAHRAKLIFHPLLVSILNIWT